MTYTRVICMAGLGMLRGHDVCLAGLLLDGGNGLGMLRGHDVCLAGLLLDGGSGLGMLRGHDVCLAGLLFMCIYIYMQSPMLGGCLGAIPDHLKAILGHPCAICFNHIL